jgi:abortive infection bacteriophage resistance protein
MKNSLLPKDIISLLKSRNLIIENEKTAEFFLQTISYNRFSSYRFPFLKDYKQNKEDYNGIATFNNISTLINNDLILKTNIFNITRGIELLLRSQINTQFGQNNPLIYLYHKNYTNNPFNQQNLKFETLQKNNEKINKLISTLKYPEHITSFKEYFHDKNNLNCDNCKFKQCNDKSHFQPIFSATEHLTFNQLIHLYKYINLNTEKQSIIEFILTFKKNSPKPNSIFFNFKDLVVLFSDIASLRNTVSHHDKIILRYKFPSISDSSLIFLKSYISTKYDQKSSPILHQIIKNNRKSFLNYYLMLKYFTILLTQNNNLNYIKDSFNNITNIFNDNFDYLISEEFKNKTKPNDITIIKSILTQI